MASYYALASQNVMMQHFLTMENEIGSHNKCPKLLKLTGFARWEPRFQAHLGSLHPKCVWNLDHVYLPPQVGSATIGYIDKLFNMYEDDERKDMDNETKGYSTLTMALHEKIFHQFSHLTTCATLFTRLKARSLGNPLESKKT